jgi:hypothetical protein
MISRGPQTDSDRDTMTRRDTEYSVTVLVVTTRASGPPHGRISGISMTLRYLWDILPKQGYVTVL